MRDCHADTDTTFTVTTLGCKVNQCDSAAMQELLEAAGYRCLEKGSTAHLHIINTCVVTGATEAQSRQLIRRALRTDPAARILVTGCYAQLDAAALQRISPRVHVLGNEEKRDVARFAQRIMTGAQICCVGDIDQQFAFTSPAHTRLPGRTRAFLKIQDGCDTRCAYCIVPTVRGPSRSLPPQAVLDRFAGLAASGYREIVLTGIHLGCYGADLDPPCDLAQMLRLIDTRWPADRMRIRLSSLEPMELTDRLIAAIAAGDSICPHLHIPLQTGADTLLARMGRPYSAARFRERMLRLTGAVPGITLGLDVIAGLPGETDAHFAQTIELLRSLPIAYLHVFPYSRRSGTRAADMEGQVPPTVCKQRAAQLRQLSATLRRRWLDSSCGETHRVLIEGRRDRTTGMLRGVSRSYLPVRLDGSDDLMNCEIDVTIQAVSDDGQTVLATRS